MKKRIDFKTDKEYFQYISKNKKEIIEFKCSVLKHADPFSSLHEKTGAIKALNTSHKDDIASGVIKRTVIGNTYNWLDTHDDVHIDNCFSKSINERKSRIWHLHDHEQKINAKVGRPDSIYEKSVDWSDLGVEAPGKTMSLFMDSSIIKDYNPLVFDQYLKGEIDQHSVGMYYVLIDLAINDPDFKEEYTAWLKYINGVGNKDEALKQGYFWAVKEAKLIEISCVLEGSNKLTPTFSNVEVEKSQCVNCGEEVTPGDDGSCPKCGQMAKTKKKSFFESFGKSLVA
jgi:hypothetical protein